MTDRKVSWHEDSPFLQSAREKWVADIDRTLDGADFNTHLVPKTLDGIEIAPLYAQTKTAPFYTRATDHWLIYQSYDRSSGESGSNSSAVNKNILDDLNNGINAVELDLLSAGKTTIADMSVEELTAILDGVQLHMIHCSLAPNANLSNAAVALEYLQQHSKTRSASFALNLDLLGQPTQNSTINYSKIAELVTRCTEIDASVSALCVDTAIYHNAGCSEAQEIAFLLATTVEYLKLLPSMTTDIALSQIRFRLPLDSDYFRGIAKLRTARELIKQVAVACGVSDFNIVIDTSGSQRTMTVLDSSNNILRSCTQAAAAMAGGANGFLCPAYDSLTAHSEKGRRLARNTHHVLIEESGLLQVHDPARGSGFIESLTQALCQAAWEQFQAIESYGGMQKALADGKVTELINTAASKRDNAISNGEHSIVGVTDYPLTNESVELPEQLPGKRDAEEFEKLRHRSHHNSRQPTITIVTLGKLKDHAARLQFCENFFATAGIKTNRIDYDDDLQIKTPLAILCGADKQYLEQLEAIQKGLYSKTDVLWITGNHPKVLEIVDHQLITECIHVKSNRVEILHNALNALGVA